MDNPVISHMVFAESLEKFLRSERYSLSPIDAHEEAAVVSVIEQTLLHYEDELQILTSTRRRLPHFYSAYQDEGTCYLVLKDNLTGCVIGGGGIRNFAGLASSEGLGELRELVVDKNYRGLGLGRMILEACLKQSRTLGYSRIYLETSSQMEQAQDLFLRCGFRPVEVQKRDQQSEHSPSFPSYFVLECV